MTKDIFKPTIKFINHASVLIEYEEISILTDPWYEGTSFNDGWELVKETNANEILHLLESVTHIWISHEHPDHFSVGFFKKYAEFLNDNNIKILFQNTLDKRVMSFLTKSLKLNVLEIDDCEWMQLGNDLKVAVKRFGIYDSSLFLNCNGTIIANLNDCHISNISELGRLGKTLPPVDVLISQFSYASWKSSPQARGEAAQKKLEMLHQQATVLKAKYVIPFASYIYFSAFDNAYMNDMINTPKKVNDYCKMINAPYELLMPFYNEIVYPSEERNPEKTNEKLILKWEILFENMIAKANSILPKAPNFSKKNPQDLIEDVLTVCNERLKNKNSVLLFNILSFFKIIRPVYFSISDVDLFVLYSPSIVGEIHKMQSHNIDITLSLDSFLFLMKHDYGLDTLTVNGRFESYGDGFKKTIKVLFLAA